MTSSFLIALANNIAANDFMTFPGYEEGEIKDIATALTVIIQSTIDHQTEFDEAKMYDFFKEIFS